MSKTAPATDTDLDAETKPTTSTEPTLYDITAKQRIPFTISKNGREFPVAHILKPLSNERFFLLQEDVQRMADRIKKLSTTMFEPKQKLWDELVESREGYKEREDWRQATHQSDCLAAINALLHVQTIDESDAEADDTDELFDDDALTKISFNAMFNGVLITNMSHSFRQESKAEMNTFMALETDDTNPNALASAVKQSKAQKLYELGRKLLSEAEGYKDASQIPAWHLAVTTESYFLRQIARAGKF